MRKTKKQMHCLFRRNSVCDSSFKAKRTANSSLSRNKVLLRWKVKRKVGVTLLAAVKKKRPSVNGFSGEAVTESTPKYKLNANVREAWDNSVKCRPSSGFKRSSSSTCKAGDCNMPSVVEYHQNDTTDHYVDTTISSCFSPVIIDDSSDADCSSAAETTNVCNTSALSDACDSKYVNSSVGECGKITHGEGYVLSPFQHCTFNNFNQ